MRQNLETDVFVGEMREYLIVQEFLAKVRMNLKQHTHRMDDSTVTLATSKHLSPCPSPVAQCFTSRYNKVFGFETGHRGWTAQRY